MWYTILLKCALTHYDTFYYYIMQAFFCQGRFFIFVGMPLKHVLSCFFFVNLHKPDGTAADSKGSTAQSPPDGFARNLCADFPSYCPEIPCNTTAFEAGFCPRTKECRTKINCDRQYACGISMQSAEKSDYASYAQALFSVSLIILEIWFRSIHILDIPRKTVRTPHRTR